MEEGRYWNDTDREWARLQSLASEVSFGMLHGGRFNFCLQPYEAPVLREDCVMVRTKLLAMHDTLQADVPDSNMRSDKALLKLTYSDWNLYQLTQAPLKALNVQVSYVGGWIIDCTGWESVIVTAATLEDGAHLTVAELFSGGFQEWSQAAWLLHRMQVPVSVQWGVECNSDCVKMQTFQRDTTVITYPEQLERVQTEDVQALTLQANVEDNWWLRAFTVRPVRIAVISAPCQPWSRAAHAAGLTCPEGRLLLRAADICGAAAVPIVVIEQVEGFANHEHFPQVMRAWRLSGYEVQWQQTLDAQHVLPAARKRHLVILKHYACPGGLPLPVVDWTSHRPPTLRTAQAVLDLPPAVEHALVPSAQVLDMYLDPFYLPQGAAQGHQVLAPFRYRVKTLDSTLGCILAQYGSQHLLPLDLLARKGLLGFFLQTDEHIRFFSGAEIAVTACLPG